MGKLLRICTILAIAGTIIAVLAFSHVDNFEHIAELVHNSGSWGKVAFILSYAIATLLVLPSTAFNLASGVLFGGWEGLILASIASVISAIAAFAMSRWLGQSFITKHIPQAAELNRQLQTVGLSYTFAARLLPLVPYGIVSFMAGISKVDKRDYLLGTVLGTPLGLAPYVWLGSSGAEAVTHHDILPLTIALTILAISIAAAAWYRQTQITLQPIEPTQS